jgi:L-cysteine:1D-myo-inositol 2-amino-2-deoxy-alpha-D-glucopyranoside ligase
MTPVMRLYDTRRGEVLPLRTCDTDHDDPIRLYSCGITPYDATHLGHAATYLTFDLLARRLVDLGNRVDGVRNVTDVDDNILLRAAELGVHYLDLATEQLAIFDDDMAALDVIDLWREPRATGAIADIRGYIARIESAGATYEVDGTVFFDTIAAVDTARFGTLSGLAQAELVASCSSHADHTKATRRHPLDFVLWKPSRVGEPSWESRWGPGRPGWHIECSALAQRELGDRIDVHGGGRDLLIPHHECAHVQAALGGGSMVGHWLHRGLVHYQGVKMSKSLGNLVFVGDLRREHPAAVIRLALITEHYRSDFEWHHERLELAAKRVDRWCGAGPGNAAAAEVRAALDDDLDVPAAIGLIDAAAEAGHGVRAASALLGICPKE